MFIDQSEFNVEKLRERLRRMSNQELIRFGRAARSQFKSEPGREVFILQLQEAQAEWRRRNPKDSSASANTSK